MSATLSDFYTRVLNSIGLVVDDEGFIKIKSGKDTILLTASGKQMVLPTKEHIGSMLGTDEHGKVVAVKVPYNPLYETAIRGDGVSLLKTKYAIENAFVMKIGIAGYMLLAVLSDPELQKNTSLALSKFISETVNVAGPGTKKLVDDTMVNNWEKLFAQADKIDGFINIHLKKNGISDGIKYTRLAVMSFPVYDSLLEAVPDTPMYGTKLRKKDIAMFKLIFEYLFPVRTKHNTVEEGSSDPEAPGFVSLMALYIKQTQILMNTFEELKSIDQEYYDKGKIDMQVTLEEILTASNVWKTEVLKVPNDMSVSQPAPQAKIPNVNVENINRATPELRAPQQQPNQYQTQPIQPMQLEQEPMSDVEKARRALYAPGPNNPSTYMTKKTANDFKAQQEQEMQARQYAQYGYANPNTLAVNAPMPMAPAQYGSYQAPMAPMMPNGYPMSGPAPMPYSYPQQPMQPMPGYGYYQPQANPASLAINAPVQGGWRFP